MWRCSCNAAATAPRRRLAKGSCLSVAIGAPRPGGRAVWAVIDGNFRALTIPRLCSHRLVGATGKTLPQVTNFAVIAGQARLPHTDKDLFGKWFRQSNNRTYVP